jgi:hypothetical protein
MTSLPRGAAPPPVPLPHFPDRLHAFVWRNWPLVPIERMARVVGAQPDAIRALGQSMGLTDAPSIPPGQERRSSLTIIRRNWHLLPYEQLLDLLGWTAEQFAYALREDDFLFIKLGSLKPDVPSLRYAPPDTAAQERAAQIAGIVRQVFPGGAGRSVEPLFAFVEDLGSPSGPQPGSPPGPPITGGDQHDGSLPPLLGGGGGRSLKGGGGRSPGDRPRFCYAYFAVYGDPLLETEVDPYPEGYLDRLAALGVNGVWLQGVLYALAPFPWDPVRSARCEERRERLAALVARAAARGMGVYLYLNEPRALPLSFFGRHPGLRGVVEGDHATLCTSVPEVREWLVDAVADLGRAVPDLAGVFTITASENLTNCASHGRAAACPRCRERPAGELFAEVNRWVRDGLRRAGSNARAIAWDWGWPDDAAEECIRRLPDDIWLMSVSEWDLPIVRGGVESRVGEYALSAIGPGPRARRHWDLARRRGLRTMAKLQLSNTWELSTVPYLPVTENVARHVAGVRAERVDGLMVGWTLGGYPSPNLEVAAEVDAGRSVEDALVAVARRRFGEALAPAVVAAWRAFSAAFAEYPYHGGVVYSAPVQLGPANLLWEAPTGYRATMVGFPYDDLDTWRAVYPPETFIAQLETVAAGFDRARVELEGAADGSDPMSPEGRALAGELRLAEVVALHCRSTANQARFVLARRALASAAVAPEADVPLGELERLLAEETALAARLHDLQAHDSRLGFEASNEYAYLPIDLAEKVINARDLLDRWLPAERRRWDGGAARSDPLGGA